MFNSIMHAAPRYAMLALLFSAAQALVGVCHAMEFSLTRKTGVTINQHKFPDYDAIVATGAIVEGDAAALSAMVRKAGRDEFGNVRIYLDSPGGNVGESFKIVELFDDIEVTAIVPSGRDCLSACASVLYLSARIHFVEDGGTLGFHTCRVGGKFPSDVCNDRISRNALHRGTHYGSVMAFMKSDLSAKVAALRKEQNQYQTDMVFFDAKSAEAYGLVGPTTHDDTLAVPPFACSGRQLSTVQRAVCSDLRLARYSASIARVYLPLIATLPDPKQVQNVRNSAGLFQQKIESCNDSRACMLATMAEFRFYLRGYYTAAKLEHTVSRMLGGRELPDEVRTAYKLFAFCRNPKDCGRTATRERQYEFASANAAFRIARNAINPPGEKDDWTQDCVFEELCSPKLKTISVIPDELGTAPETGKK